MEYPRLHKIFNLQAELIVLHDSLIKAKRRKTETKSRREAVSEEASAFLAQYEEEIIDSLRIDISDQTYSEILQYAKECNSAAGLQRLIAGIDRLIDFMGWLSGIRGSNNHDVVLTSLNSNCGETGIVLVPNTCTSLYEHAYRKPYFDRIKEANGCMNNFYYYHIGDIDKKVKHHLLGVKMENAELSNSNPVIKVALAPICPGTFDNVFTDEDIERIEKDGIIYISDLRNEAVKDIIFERYRVAVIMAGAMGADILVCPEMLGTYEVVQTRQSGNDDYSVVLRSLVNSGVPLPKLIFAPTYWHDHQNVSFIYDNAGYQIVGQHKQIEYRKDFPKCDNADNNCYAEESLANKEEVIHILHVDNVGRFVATICCDFLDPEYIGKLAGVLRTSFFVTQACSNGMEHFKIAAGGIVTYNAHMVLVNSSAHLTDIEIKKRSTQNFVAAELPIANVGHVEKECLQCGKCSNGCIYLLDLPLKTKEYLNAVGKKSKKDSDAGQEVKPGTERVTFKQISV